MQKKTDTTKKERSIKLQFTDWLYREYDVSFLPKQFFINLDKVYKGTYKNLSKPVPLEDLWDMWQKKMPYLLKLHDKNKRSGKDMDGMCRIYYDMSVVLAKYDSYLKWKEEQKLAQVEEKDKAKSIDIRLDKITNLISNNDNNNSNTLDIDSILDEI
jgi:hypothetical protein